LAEGRAEQERQVETGPPRLLGDAQPARQHDRTDRTARERAPDGQRPASSIATAAFTSERCVSPCRKVPRNSPPAASSCSAYSPTSFASATSSSISPAASSTRPARASAETSQNEHGRNAPSSSSEP